MSISHYENISFSTYKQRSCIWNNRFDGRRFAFRNGRADGAVENYTRWPEAHRPETLVDAVRLDRLLNRAWRDRPHYYRIDNQDRNWHQKAELARGIISSFAAHQKSEERRKEN